jgi:hypothetical protein
MTRSSRQYPDISISVKIDLGTSKRSRATLKALIPDNLNFPKGMSLMMSSRGSIISLQLCGKSIGFDTLTSTLDEVLEHISVCQKVMPK